MPERSIEISVQPAYLKYNYVYIPAQQTGFFPPGMAKTKKPVLVDSEAGEVRAQLQYNSLKRVWFLGLRGWFKSHPKVKARDKIKITEIEPGKRYRFVLK